MIRAISVSIILCHVAAANCLSKWLLEVILISIFEVFCLKYLSVIDLLLS